MKTLNDSLFSSKWWYSALIVVVWGHLLLNYCRGIINRIPLLGNMTDLVIMLCFILPIMFSWRIWSKKYLFSDFLFFAITASIYLMQIILYPSNTEIPQGLLPFVFSVLPCYFFGRLLNVKEYDDILFLVSSISILLTAIYYFAYAQGVSEVETEQYNMNASYNVLPHVIYVLWRSLRKPGVVVTCLSLLSVMELLSFGTRGPLLCVAVFVIVYVLNVGFEKHSYFKKACVLAIGICLILFTDQIMELIQNLLVFLNMSTRIVDKYFLDEIAYGSGRDEIATQLTNIIQNGDFPFFGEGLYGSYRFVGTYPHNIILEIIFSFGILMGSTLLMFLLFIVLFGYKCTCSLYEKGFFILLMCVGLVKLFMSGSFLNEQYLFMLLGYSITMIRCQKNYQCREA